MNHRYCLALLPLAAGIIAMACNGDGRLPLDEYFQQIEPLFNTSTTLSANLEQQLEGKLPAAQSDEERILVVQEFLTPVENLYEAMIIELENLDPPGKVEDAHEEALAATRELFELITGLSARLEDVESVDNLEELQELTAELEEPEFTAAEGRRNAACAKLQEIAGANALTVELACAEGQE
jgi:hypothetical protein